MIRCGHCKQTHDTVAQVRLCAHRDWEARSVAKDAGGTPQPTSAPAEVDLAAEAADHT